MLTPNTRETTQISSSLVKQQENDQFLPGSHRCSCFSKLEWTFQARSATLLSTGWAHPPRACIRRTLSWVTAVVLLDPSPASRLIFRPWGAAEEERFAALWREEGLPPLPAADDGRRHRPIVERRGTESTGQQRQRQRASVITKRWL